MRSLCPVVSMIAVLVAPQALAGRGKILELKGAPRTVGALAEAITKEKKDANRRSALSLMLDDLLRKQPELTDPVFYDNLANALFNDVLEKMAEPTETFTTETASDKFNPRADIFFREQVKVRPGRVSAEFRRRYMKKPAGKNIDRGYRNQPLNLEFTTAASEDEFNSWVDSKSWGVVVHAAHVDPTTGIARIGCTFISNGSKDAPGGRFERPSWIAFYKQPKPGSGNFVPLSIESETASDWRVQPINVIPPKVELNELAKKLSLAVWMEQVRALPPRPAFREQEQALFELKLDGTEKIELTQPLLEPFRDSDSPMVRAAAELQVAALGGPWKPDSTYIISRQVKHPVVKARLEELLKKAPAGWTPPQLPPEKPEKAAPAVDAGASVKTDAGK